LFFFPRLFTRSKYPFSRDLSFLSLVFLLGVARGAVIRLFGTRGDEVDGAAEEEDVGSHDVLLFSAAEPAPAHDILLDADTVASAVVFLSASAAAATLGDHVILLGFGFDAGDGDDSDDERENFSWNLCDDHDARYLFSRDRAWKCGWGEKSQYPKDIYVIS
jgi:hypothetical protein